MGKRLVVIAALFAAMLPLAAGAAPLELAEGYRPGATAMAVAPDGGTFVAVQAVDRDSDFGQPGRRPDRLEFFRLRADGSVAQARSLDVEGKEALGGPRLAVLPDGDVAIFAPLAPREGGRRTLAHLLRLSPDGLLRHRAAIGHPNYASASCRIGPDSALFANFLAAGPRGTLLVGGGYCGGPYVPWWGLFSANGVKLAEGDDLGITPGPGVTSGAFGPDGSFRLAGSHFQGLGRFDAVLGFYGPDGAIRARHILLERGGEVGTAIFTAEGIAFVGDSRRNDPAVRLYDRDGRATGSAAWPEKDMPTALVADGAGVAGFVEEPGGARHIVRIDGSGRIAWSSPSGVWLALAGAAQGELRALVEQRDANGRYWIEPRTFGKP